MEGASAVLAVRLGVPQVVCEICLRLPAGYLEYHPAVVAQRRYWTRVIRARLGRRSPTPAVGQVERLGHGDGEFAQMA